MTKQEGKEKTPQYVAFQRGAVPPRIMYTLGHRKTRDKSPQEPPEKTDQENRNPETRAKTANNIGGSGKIDRVEMIASSPDHFRTPSENVGDIEPSKRPSIT